MRARRLRGKKGVNGFNITLTNIIRQVQTMPTSAPFLTQIPCSLVITCMDLAALSCSPLPSRLPTPFFYDADWPSLWNYKCAFFYELISPLLDLLDYSSLFHFLSLFFPFCVSNIVDSYSNH